MDAFSIFEKRKKAMDSLKEAVRKIVSSSTPSTFFIIDELDRCRPDYAITYLETIKHIFDIKGSVFILAADRQQLENSAKTAFGLELDFEEYYRKFLHREVTLPPISNAGYAALAKKYVNDYLNRNGSRFCFMNLEQYLMDRISELIGGLRLTPRQLQEMFRTLGHLFASSANNKGHLSWGLLGVGSIAMLAFKLGAPEIFHDLGAQQLDAVKAIDVLKKIVGDSSVPLNWWFTLFLTGGGLQIAKGESLEDVMTRAGLVDKEGSNDLHIDLSQWQREWGSRSNRFQGIYEKIQQISQWD